MIVNRGETKSMKVNNGTIDGIRFNITLLAAAANAAITTADFNPEQISVKVELKRDRAIQLIVQDNLLVLGLFASKNYGVNDWYKGNVVTPPAVGVTSALLVSLYLNFGGCINVMEDDELIITLVCGSGTFGANLSQSNSFVEFNESVAIGVERATPQIFTQVVQANITKERYALGDNVARIMFLQFDQNSIQNQVISSLNLSSDKLQDSYNFNDLFNQDKNKFVAPAIAYRYGNTQPLTGGNEAFPYLPKYPQTLCIYAWSGGKSDVLNNCFVDISYNGSLVNASQNYVAAQRFILSKLVADRAAAKIEKHLIANHEHAM